MKTTLKKILKKKKSKISSLSSLNQMMPSFPVNGIGKTHREWLGGRTVPASLKFEGKLKRSLAGLDE